MKSNLFDILYVDTACIIQVKMKVINLFLIAFALYSGLLQCNAFSYLDLCNTKVTSTWFNMTCADYVNGKSDNDQISFNGNDNLLPYFVNNTIVFHKKYYFELPNNLTKVSAMSVGGSAWFYGVGENFCDRKNGTNCAATFAVDPNEELPY